MIPSPVHLADPIIGVVQQFSSRLLALWEPAAAATSNTTMPWVQRKYWRAIFGLYVKYSEVIVEYTWAMWAGAGFMAEESVSRCSLTRIQYGPNLSNPKDPYVSQCEPESGFTTWPRNQMALYNTHCHKGIVDLSIVFHQHSNLKNIELVYNQNTDSVLKQ